MRERIFSTHAVAQMVGTNPSSVVRWIESGKLKAYKTPGGHRRIREADLRAFFKGFEIPLPPELTGGVAGRLMIVDGDGRSAGALARALRRAAPQSEVFTVSDAVEALLRVGAAPPDAVVVDGSLVDVPALARALRGQPQTADTSVVVILPRVDAEVEKRLRSSGVQAVLSRPANADQILAALRGEGRKPRGRASAR